MTYVASPIKRARATAEEMDLRRLKLVRIVQAGKPMTVRQVFYQATIAGVVEKTEAGYAKVQRALVELRHDGLISWNSIADHTRWQRKPRSFSDPKEALIHTANLYRKAVWDDLPVYVEVWLEKDALAGVVYPITSQFDVPLMVTRGYSSITFLHQAAADILEIGKPTFIYQLGDHDPSGVDAAHKIRDGLLSYADGAEIHFERIAVTPAQIERMKLPTRPTKKSDTRAKGFEGDSVELDAIDPGILRALVRAAIEGHIPRAAFDALKAAEASEREALIAFARSAA